MSTSEIGPQLRALRTASGRTVASVAVDAGLSVPYVANLENGRGNPTAAALSQLAGALGVRLVISLVPPHEDADTAPAPAADVPASLVRLGRSGRFQDVLATIADKTGQDRAGLGPRLVGALAQLAGTLRYEPDDAGWWRVLDALLLMVAYPVSADFH